MPTMAVPHFVDSYHVLSILPNASKVEVSKAWKRLALSLHPDKNPNEDTTERFQQLQDAYDAIKTPRERQNHDIRRNQYLIALEAARMAAEAAALAAKETRESNERWERDQKQRKQREKQRKEKDVFRIQREQREKRKRAAAEEEARLVADILRTFRYRRISPIKRALYRSKEHWDYQIPILFEFKNRIHASYQARAGMHIEFRNRLIKSIIHQQYWIHHTRSQTVPNQLSEDEKLKQDQELRSTFKALRRECFDYEKQHYEWRQSISAEALRIIGPRNPFLVENDTSDYFEPARCFWESFAEISHPLGADIILMITSKLWNQASFGFVTKGVGVGEVSDLASEPQNLDALRNLWERKMEDGPWHSPLGERLCTPVGQGVREDICGRCCLKTSFGEHETVASRCEKCEMVICETCRVELEILREFGEWVNEIGAYSGQRFECLYGPPGKGWIFNGEIFVSEYNL
ncbi:hypothetical protein EYC80_000190 [Monilinia laxa]|uniref:J domain-containing protein n=1 Tax=Monilinia laxa TaxID=61186 RepID=A0A5N6K9V7_MONLA|nr:hypothetical protein EYC80_000190 [Monilinia laxa]